MRHLYLDEAGLGPIEQEPYTVVAGFAMHVDDQYDMLMNYLLDMVADLISPCDQLPSGFYLSAKDLWHGGGFFPRDIWPRERRMEILGHLADIPNRFKFFVFCAYIDRLQFWPSAFDRLGEKAAAGKVRHANRINHSISLLCCLSSVNSWASQFYSNEKVFVILENHRDHREALTNISDAFTDPVVARIAKTDEDRQLKSFDKIVDSPAYVNKSLGSPTQIADVCAFVLSKRLSGDALINDLYAQIESRLVYTFDSSLIPALSPRELSQGAADL